MPGTAGPPGNNGSASAVAITSITHSLELESATKKRLVVATQSGPGGQGGTGGQGGPGQQGGNGVDAGGNITVFVPNGVAANLVQLAASPAPPGGPGDPGLGGTGGAAGQPGAAGKNNSAGATAASGPTGDSGAPGNPGAHTGVPAKLTASMK